MLATEHDQLETLADLLERLGLCRSTGFGSTRFLGRRLLRM